MVTGTGYAPYADSSLPDGGLATEVVKQALLLSDVSITLEWQPWARNLATTAAGRHWGTFPYRRTPERERDFLFSDPIFESQERIFGHAALQLDGSRLSTLTGRRICLPLGWSAPEPIAKLVEAGQITVEKPVDIQACLRMIVAKRVDFFVTDLTQGKANLRQEMVPNVVLHPGVVGTSAYHLIASRNQEKTPWLIDRFNKGLSRLKAQGRYRQLLQKYGHE
ncbi:ABC transporter substrate-binding protein [Chitinimonas sp. BJYL2]|uniref:substrate-binding periplasmic protein n=1 Tax=Chitinimonas sp. BJYL2 TaxID=2976696 RepID=UPI0022B51F31|nr:transporter substrate-binding domain-containing protein [Chitinimonas sp. BJYL2]